MTRTPMNGLPTLQRIRVLVGKAGREVVLLTRDAVAAELGIAPRSVPRYLNLYDDFPRPFTLLGYEQLWDASAIAKFKSARAARIERGNKKNRSK